MVHGDNYYQCIHVKYYGIDSFLFITNTLEDNYSRADRVLA